MAQWHHISISLNILSISVLACCAFGWTFDGFENALECRVQIVVCVTGFACVFEKLWRQDEKSLHAHHFISSAIAQMVLWSSARSTSFLLSVIVSSYLAYWSGSLVRLFVRLLFCLLFSPCFLAWLFLVRHSKITKLFQVSQLSSDFFRVFQSFFDILRIVSRFSASLGALSIPSLVSASLGALCIASLVS